MLTVMYDSTAGYWQLVRLRMAKPQPAVTVNSHSDVGLTAHNNRPTRAAPKSSVIFHSNPARTLAPEVGLRKLRDKLYVTAAKAKLNRADWLCACHAAAASLCGANPDGWLSG